jgi:adenylate kinase
VLTKRLEEFRAKNTEENTMLNYFDENEIHPLILSIENTTEAALIAAMYKHIGKPHNYGPTPEQVAERRQKCIEERVPTIPIILRVN